MFRRFFRSEARLSHDNKQMKRELLLAMNQALDAIDENIRISCMANNIKCWKIYLLPKMIIIFLPLLFSNQHSALWTM